jgi:hypothetical protein
MEAARLWARGELDTADHDDDQADDGHLDKALGAFGLVVEEGLPGDRPAPPAVPVYHLWPCNKPAWDFFLDCVTQWRADFSGRSGLDYAGVEALMRLQRIAWRRRPQLLALVRCMELGALKGWAQQREEGAGVNGT